MADTWLKPDKKKSLLDYIKQGANEEDLLAAGFSPKDLSEIGWDKPSKKIQGPQKPDGALEPYTPTKRDNLRDNVEGLLTTFGVPEASADNFAKGVAGNRDEMGLADLSPLGILFGAEEGGKKVKSGWNNGSATEMGLGALDVGLSVAEAFPAVKAVSKGVKALAGKAAKVYDPTVLRTFFGPESKNADLASLERAKEMKEKGFRPDEIWMREGWYESPKNGWRFEVDDSTLKLPDSIESQNATSAIGDSDRVLNHPNFWDSLTPNTSMGDGAYFDADIKSKDIAGATTKLGFTPPKGYQGVFRPDSGNIEAYGRGPDDIRQTAVHEMQHAEQDVFGRKGAGASPSYVGNQFNMFLDNLPKTEQIAARDLMKLGQAEAYAERLDRDIAWMKEAKADQKSNWQEFSQKALENMESERENLSGYLDTYNQESVLKSVSKDLQEDLLTFKDIAYGISKHSLSKGGQGKAPLFDLRNPTKLNSWAEHALYELDAGETEARLAMDRFHLSPEERAISPPDQWLDADPKDVYTKEELSGWQDQVKDKMYKSRGYAEGGAVEPIDSVSGNPIPPGSLPQEVRDDVDAKLSSGEYVLPADVVRYFGLDYIEKLITKAKTGLEELQANGRIGGKSEDDLPFSPEELDAHEAEMAAPAEAMTMATGGYVPPPMGVSDEATQGPVNPATGLPWWMSNGAVPNTTPKPTAPYKSNGNSEDSQPLTGLAGNPDQWSPKDFMNYTKSRNSGLNKIIETGISSFIPFGKLGLQHRHNYLNKTVPGQLEKMISTGMTTKGEKLSPEDITSLKASLDKVKSEGGYTPGLVKGGGKLGEGLKNLAQKIFPKESEKKTTKSSSSKPASKPSSTSRPKANPSNAGKSKPTGGGFISRR